jgi:flagellin
MPNPIGGQGPASQVRHLRALSSGKRVARMEDVPTGEAVVAKLTAEAGARQQTLRNINDGFAVSQLAGGAAGAASELVDKMRDLASGAATRDIGGQERDALQARFKRLAAEVDRLAAGARFGDLPLADGTASSLVIQAPDAGADIDVPLADLSTGGLGIAPDQVDLGSPEGAADAMGRFDGALDRLSQAREAAFAAADRLEASFGALEGPPTIPDAEAAKSVAAAAAESPDDPVVALGGADQAARQLLGG